MNRELILGSIFVLSFAIPVHADYPTSSPYAEKTTVIEETTTYSAPRPEGSTVIEETTTYPGPHPNETTVVEETTTYPGSVIYEPIPEPPYETTIEEETIHILPE